MLYYNIIDFNSILRKLYEQLYDLKVIHFLKSTVKLDEKELSYDDFVKEAQKN